MCEVMSLSDECCAARSAALIAAARAASREHFIESWDRLLTGDRSAARRDPERDSQNGYWRL